MRLQNAPQTFKASETLANGDEPKQRRANESHIAISTQSTVAACEMSIIIAFLPRVVPANALRFESAPRLAVTPGNSTLPED